MVQRVSIKKLRQLRPDLSGDWFDLLIAELPRLDRDIQAYLETHSASEIKQQIEKLKKMYRKNCDLHAGHGELPLLYCILNYEQGLEELAIKQAEARQKAQEEADERARKIGEAAAKTVVAEVLKSMAEQAAEIEKLKVVVAQQDKIVDEYKAALEESQKALEIQQLKLDYLQLAQENRYLTELLQKIDDPLNAILVQAACAGDLKKAKAAIRLGADVNAQDMQGETPLHKACAHNDKAMIQFLLASGGDLSIKDINGRAADALATDPEVLQLCGRPLQRLGASAKHAPRGPTLFARPHLACKKEDAEEEAQYRPKKTRAVPLH